MATGGDPRQAFIQCSASLDTVRPAAHAMSADVLAQKIVLRYYGTDLPSTVSASFDNEYVRNKAARQFPGLLLPA